jgi:hypothetical protein
MISFQTWHAEPNAYVRKLLADLNFKSLQEASENLEISETVLTALLFSSKKLLSDRDISIVAEKFGMSKKEWLINWYLGFENQLD